jgi:hypothetical protein
MTKREYGDKISGVEVWNVARTVQPGKAYRSNAVTQHRSVSSFEETEVVIVVSSSCY